MMHQPGYPPAQGLYDPSWEHDACGIGFVVDIEGRRSHGILRQALTILVNLAHRGGCGSEPETGDGAGLLMQIPHGFFAKVCRSAGLDLPEPGRYAVGTIFLPPDEGQRTVCEEIFARIIAEEAQPLLGWRTVPVDPRSLGATARAAMPAIRQIFIGRGSGCPDEAAFERKLYVIRRRAEKAIRYANLPGGAWFYAASLSCRTVVYKGMLTAAQVGAFYPDLADPAVETALALVHSRYSTNTFPSWERAHPYRYIIHNGEINTLRGNVNWMRARQAGFSSPLFGADLTKILPVLNEDGSDSALFDNCLEFLYQTGRSLPHAVMMMIPEPWSRAPMSDEKRAFYEYHSCLMEPWDGPAAIAFTDGVRVGAVLDRNGLRPSRYYVTADGLVIMASETGVVEVPPERVLRKGRLQPGRMLLVDTAEGRIVSDEEIKGRVAAEHPYRAWLDEHQMHLDRLPAPPPAPRLDAAVLRRRQRAFGYTHEDLHRILAPMARDGVEPVGAMGYDAPLAVLSERPQLLYDYFKQLFAQVTNPPLDALREEIVTGTEIMVGSEGDLLSPRPESCRRIKLKTPLLAGADLERMRRLKHPGFKPAVLSILFPVSTGEEGLVGAMDALCAAADLRIREGANILILSDREMDEEHASIPALLAVAGLHHHLIRERTRTRVSLIVESGEPREVHHFALLLGYGASAVHPYLALASLAGLIEEGALPGLDRPTAEGHYLKAATKGVLKVLSKMGISTIQGYQGAQIFEAVGLHRSVIDRYFTRTPSRLGGIDLRIIARETLLRHAAAFGPDSLPGEQLESGSHYQWRRDGEYHLYNPETIQLLQHACRTGDYDTYKRYAAALHDQSRLCHLRGLLGFREAEEPVPLDEVEPVSSICRRFKTGAMSYGSLSKEAHEALAIAMNRIGGKSNSGEGGEDPARFTPDPNGDSRCSAIKQVASGRFGVTSAYLNSAREIQIKIAQGAKPGEGGQLPGRKVYPWIAHVRHATPGVGLISPPPHHDIYSIEDLAELIHDLKNANPEARIGVKLVAGAGVGTIAAGVAKGRADLILISGYDGGTGAAPRSSIRHAGLPWELGLAETQQTLVLNGLRGRVVLEVDGKLMTGRDVAVAALLGAEEFGFATAPLVALGCVMMRVCNLDTCPAGIATQHPELRRRFAGDPQHVVNLMQFIAREVREIMAQLGFRTMDEMIGRTDRLIPLDAQGHWKAKHLDLAGLLHQPAVPPATARRHVTAQDHGLERSLDRRMLLEICRPALEEGKPVRAILPIRNTDRVVGAILGSEVTRRYGAAGLPEDAIRLIFKGSAGQSFGAFIPRGVTLCLEGDANDYLGKGLSGGKIVAYPPEGSPFAPEENILAGNVVLYGATGGEAYLRGQAGERFCVRNSGANAVVEGVGDHGCEYMTGGRVVILGPTGRNFAAGMSGGIAYVLDEEGDFAPRCNREMVDLEPLAAEDDQQEVISLLKRHADHTGSEAARRILVRWEYYRRKFVKVMPRDYRRALQSLKAATQTGRTGDEATLAAFEENRRDVSRVSGN